MADAEAPRERGDKGAGAGTPAVIRAALTGGSVKTECGEWVRRCRTEIPVQLRHDNATTLNYHPGRLHLSTCEALGHTEMVVP